MKVWKAVSALGSIATFAVIISNAWTEQKRRNWKETIVRDGVEYVQWHRKLLDQTRDGLTQDVWLRLRKDEGWKVVESEYSHRGRGYSGWYVTLQKQAH